VRIVTVPWLKRALWAMIAVQGVLAVWVSHPWLTADSGEYLKLANALLQGSYGSQTSEGFQPDVLRPPGYPIIIYVLHHVMQLPFWVISSVQIAAYWLSLFLIQRMLERFGLEPWPMLALAAVYPFPAMYSANIMTEAWAGLALTGIAAVLVLWKRFLLACCVAGALGGIAILLRADLLLLPPLVGALILLMNAGQQADLGRRAAGAVLSLVVAVLVVLPYTAWNLKNFGVAKPLPLAGALGNSLYIATWQPVLPREDINALYSGVATPRAEAAGLADEVRAMNKAIGAPLLTAPWNPAAYPSRPMQIASTKHTLNLALQRISKQPLVYGRHVAQNSWRLWITGVYPQSVPRPAVALLSLGSAIVLLLGICGALVSLLQRPSWPVPRWLAVLFLYVPAVHIFLHTEARYTAPARPLLLLFAGAFCVLAIRKFAVWWPKPKGSPAILAD
jgi:hypothetical protein